MKTKSKKYNSSLPPERRVQEKIFPRKNYRHYYSRAHPTDFYQQCHNYRFYPSYKHRNSPTKRFPRSNERNQRSRPISPILGSEEYMKKKIEETSANIMKQLLNPDQQCFENLKQSNKDERECSANVQTGNDARELSVNNSNCKSKIKKSTDYNIDDIHKKIMNHITNLNNGKKKNLINFNLSSYDAVIDQIQKQKRLEISRALRAMCSKSKDIQESSDFINSIIPDMGIKIEDLPQDLIEELTNTLNLDSGWSSDDGVNHYFGGSNQRSTINVLDKSNGTVFERQRTNNQIELSDEWKNDQVIIIPDDDDIKKEIDYNSFEVGGSNSKDGINMDCSPNLSSVENDGESASIAIVAIKNEICEQVDSDCWDTETKIVNNYQDVTDNIKKEISEQIEAESEIINSYQDFTDDIKKEICEDDEYDNSSYVLESNQTNIENMTDENCDLNNLSTTFVETEVCHITKEIQGINADNSFKIIDAANSPLKEPGAVMQRNYCDDEVMQNTYVLTSDISTQTEENLSHCAEKCIDNLLTECYKQSPTHFSDAVSRMFEIDRCVLKLTKYRQSLFTNMKSFNKTDRAKNNLGEMTVDSNISGKYPKGNRTKSQVVKEIVNKRNRNRTKKANKKKKSDLVINLIRNNLGQKVINKDPSHVKSNSSEEPCIQTGKPSEKNIRKAENGIGKNRHKLEFPDFHEKVLVIKVIEDKLVVGTESGKVIFFNLENSCSKKILNVCSVPITSILFIKDDDTGLFYVGSFNLDLKIYNFINRSIVQNVTLNDSVQCMECNWGYIFIGCIRGSLLRYSLKKYCDKWTVFTVWFYWVPPTLLKICETKQLANNVNLQVLNLLHEKKAMECEDKFSDDSILVLKATQEGARRVLLIGSRNSPVCIRDAMTGLYMRTMEDLISPTVYSLIMDKSLVYCGTTNHDILVYSFHDGKLMQRHRATESKGIGCMKIVSNLLFASCHNGDIYVYDIKKNIFIATIYGPGGVILSMEIFENQVIVSTMSFKFVSLLIPKFILNLKI